MEASHFGLDSESIDIVLVFLNSTCLLEITDLVNSSLFLVVIAIIFPNCIVDLFISIKPMRNGFPLFQLTFLYTSANVGQSLYLVTGLHYIEVIIHLKNPSL